MPARTLADKLAQADEERFVGRRKELALLDRLLVEEPPAHVVLLHGPGGLGKSTLLREVARRGRARGFFPVMADGRALAPAPGEIERALAGVEELWRPLILLDTFERLETLGGWLRERLLPTLPAGAGGVLAGGHAPDPAPPAAPPPARRRRRTRRAQRPGPRLGAAWPGVDRQLHAAGAAPRGRRA